MFYELPKGGATNAVIDISKSLISNNNLVDLYSTVPFSKQDKKFFSRVYEYSISLREWNGRNWKRRIYRDIVESSRLYLHHKRIAKIIDKRGYDAVFVNASQYIESPFILRFLKTKKIMYCHDPYDRLIYDPVNKIPSNISFIKSTYEKVYRYIRKIVDYSNFQKANIIIANSQYSASEIKKVYGRDSTVCYLGVDTKIFSPTKTTKKIDVLFIGSTSPLDGFETFLETVSYFPKGVTVRSILAEQEWIESKFEMSKIYNASKLVICLGVREPLGLTPLEAMACKIPVVAVNEAGYKETVIDSKTGYLIKRDPRLIADKVLYLLNNKSVATKMGKEGRAQALNFWSLQKMGKTFTDTLRTL